MFTYIKILIGVIPSLCYNITDFYYKSNNIDIYIEDCPIINCIPLIIKTANKWILPGISFNIKWNIKEPSINYILKNEISFKYNKDYGFTTFQITDNIIINFKMFINPYGITQNVLHNILLHEFGHIFLLKHSIYNDSVMGYKILINQDKTVNIYQKKIQLTDDDVSGIYSIEFAKNKNNYLYSLYIKELFYHTDNII